MLHTNIARLGRGGVYLPNLYCAKEGFWQAPQHWSVCCTRAGQDETPFSELEDAGMTLIALSGIVLAQNFFLPLSDVLATARRVYAGLRLASLAIFWVGLVISAAKWQPLPIAEPGQRGPDE